MGKIGFIAPYDRACKIACELAAKKNVDLICKVAVLDEAVAFAHKLFESDKVTAVISRTPTSNYLMKEFKSSIININISNYAFLRALDKARQVDSLIAFVDIAQSDYGLDTALMERLLNIKIVRIEMESFSDRERCLSEVRRIGAKVIVSTAACLRKAAAIGTISVVMIELEQESLAAALDAAIEVDRITTQAKNVNEYIDNDRDGIFLVDENGLVQVFNRTMSQLTGMDAARTIGKSIHALAKLNRVFYYISEKQHLFEFNKVRYFYTSFQTYSSSGANEIFKIVSSMAAPPYPATISNKQIQANFCAKHTFESIIGTSESILLAKKTAANYAHTMSNVMLIGESGTGKELFAQSIHNESPVHAGPFVAINCAALPEHLLESELYGYEDGAFTGAKRGGKVGLFELSQGGTLFLDELGEIPLALQSRLLRSIQERQIIRIGGTKIININNRIICATNRDLSAAVEDGSFRKDLYYRLNILRINVPPLRERRGDIVQLAQILAQKYHNSSGQTIHLPSKLLEQLSDRDWPGNVRQLDGFLESLIVTCDGDTIDDAHFHRTLEVCCPPKKEQLSSEGLHEDHEHGLFVSLGTLKQIEQQVINATYTHTGYNIKKTMKQLAISRTTLWRKLDEGLIEKMDQSQDLFE